MNEDIFENLVEKFLEGNATSHEKEILSNWLREEPKAEEVFYFLVSKRESKSPQYLPETESKIMAYEAFLKGEAWTWANSDHETVSISSRMINYRYWWVASVILLISVGFYYFLNESLLYKNYHSESGAIRIVMLEDGTRVTLNANSSINVLRNFFWNAHREVWINGEAFFEVKKNSDRTKFIVHATNFDVEVLGTKFNVSNRHGKSEVILSEGRIKLVKGDRAPLIMSPGERVSLSDAHGRFERSAANRQEYQAWRNSMMVFENTPLSEVAQMILDYYGVNVVINDPLLAKREFTGTLPNDDLNVILLALRTAYNVDVERVEGGFILMPNTPK
jgi:ferric-dicitrate binding protein FerR (iron transport regulator)